MLLWKLEDLRWKRVHEERHCCRTYSMKRNIVIDTPSPLIEEQFCRSLDTSMSGSRQLIKVCTQILILTLQELKELHESSIPGLSACISLRLTWQFPWMLKSMSYSARSRLMLVSNNLYIWSAVVKGVSPAGIELTKACKFLSIPNSNRTGWYALWGWTFPSECK